MICIPLTKGKHAVIDDADWPLVSQFKWSAMTFRNGSKYYARTAYPIGKGKQRQITLHRLIMKADDELIQVDHIDGNGLNNVRENLRLCNHGENQRNAKQRVDNSSGFKGVYWDNWNLKWKAQIRYNGKNIHLGRYSTQEEAHIAYCEAAKRLHKEFANVGVVRPS